MKTAIIYRSNENLDAALANLKDKVDLFHVFPAGTKKEEIRERLASGVLFETLYDSVRKAPSGRQIPRSSFQVICDMTCMDCFTYSLSKFVIRQSSNNPHEDYILDIANEAKNTKLDVVIIKDCLAHHCTLDGVNPYKIEIDDIDGWYLDKVLETWLSIFAKESVLVEVVSKEVELEKLYGKMIICDHHNSQLANKLYNLAEEGKLTMKSAYLPVNGSFTDLSEIPILLTK